MSQRIVSFELTMPNKGSWDGNWTGTGSKYYIIKRLSNKFLISKDYFQDLIKNLSDSWYYSWGDGWGANVKAEIIDGTEARKRRRISAGFSGYDWMVQEIISTGKIKNQ